MSRAAAAGLLLLAGAALGCDDTPSSTSPSASSPSGSARAATTGSAAPTKPDDLLSRLEACDVRHRGILLDVGSGSVDPHRSYAVGPFDDVTNQKHGGATIGRVLTKRLFYDFWLDEDVEQVVASLRIVGGAARRASVYIDDKRLGSMKLSREQTRIASLPPLDGLTKGRHTLTLRFSGTARTTDDPYAEIDWIRLGPPDDEPGRYAAPTFDTLLHDVVRDETPKRSLVLRAPGSVRCALRVVRGARFSVSLGYWGNGEGSARIRVIEDGESPVVVAERKVSGGRGKTWLPLDLSLDAFESRLVAIEMQALETTGGGRVAFGEPSIVVDAATHHGVPETRTAVVIVWSGLARDAVPPWGPVRGLSAFAALSRDGVAFDRYRAPTTVVSGVVGSLLSGLPPRSHALEDPLARLPNEIRAIGEMVKEASGRAAMFTGVPMSFSAFGFDRGWDRYESFSPVKDVPAAEPLIRAAAWLKDQLERDPEARHLLVVHLRGGHPPWDLTKDDASKLPPKEYTGALEPRRGAITLSDRRARRRGARRLREGEWIRLRALSHAALRQQDRELSHLLDVLHRTDRYRDALVMIVGDVARGDPPDVPFAPAPRLREDRLAAPLVVKFPGRALAGKRAAHLATTVDLPRTILEALRLEVPEHVRGIDLFRTASGFEPLDGRPHTATLGNGYATRWGTWLLRGELRRKPSLCRIDIDPACANDVLDANGLASMALWRRTYGATMEAISSKNRVRDREAASFGPEDRAALKVFGY